MAAGYDAIYIVIDTYDIINIAVDIHTLLRYYAVIIDTLILIIDAIDTHYTWY